MVILFVCSPFVCDEVMIGSDDLLRNTESPTLGWREGKHTYILQHETLILSDHDDTKYLGIHLTTALVSEVGNH